MAKTKHGLQETTGVYQVRGIVNGVDKEKFYTDKKTKTNKDMRIVNFGIEFDKGKTSYLGFNGMVKDEVYFSKRDAEGKSVVEKVKWNARDTFNKQKGKEDFSLMGMRIGLEKGEDGKNIKQTLAEYDACLKIKELLEDDMSVFSKCKIEFSSFEDDKHNKKRSIKFVPQQISLCSNDVNFDEEGFEPKSDFSQQIIFMGIDKKDNGEFTVKAKIVTYSSIEDTEFTIKDKSLAQMFKQKLKPYNAIQVHGHVEVIENVSQVEDDDDNWGESDPTSQIGSPTERILVITGAKGKTLDKDTYTEEKINEAMQKLEQSNNAQQDWGTSSSKDVDDDEWGD